MVRHDYALEWMRDFDAFSSALNSDSSYNANLSRSLSLTLDEFYKDLTAVGFSAVTGEGFDEFLAAIDAAVVEYETYVAPFQYSWLMTYLAYLFSILGTIAQNTNA